MHIRKMTVTDIQGVYDVAKITWHDTYQKIIPEDIQDRFIEFAYVDNMLKKRMAQSIFLVAEKDGNVVGFIDIFKKSLGAKAELNALYVLPSEQGKGIGTMLLSEGLKLAGAIDSLLVVVEKENESGRRFYDAKGFRKRKEFEEEFMGWKLNSVEMILHLDHE